MKRAALFLAFICLASCAKPPADLAAASERPPENGAQFKEREGVALTETMKKSIGLEIADVEEAKVAPEFAVSMHVLGNASGFQPIALASGSRTASGWLTTSQAAHVKPGLPVMLRADGRSIGGRVQSVEKSAFHLAGEFEVIVQSDEPLEIGARVLATFRGEAAELAVAIPRSALLKTAEGTFVYAVNGERYLRAPVKAGAENEEWIEITDGLYAGDQVVTRGVMQLWLAELQVLRGGKACTCGH